MSHLGRASAGAAGPCRGRAVGGRAPLRSPSLRSGSLRSARPPTAAGQGAALLLSPERGTGILIVVRELPQTLKNRNSNCR